MIGRIYSEAVYSGVYNNIVLFSLHSSSKKLIEKH